MPFTGRDTIEALLREASETIVMPHFKNLAGADIHEKSPGEIVTAADKEAEALITQRLARLYPQARIVGEEAVSERHSLLDNLNEGEVFLVDPIDGTAHFAAGRPPFALMIAYLKDGELLASWMFDPLDNLMHEAEKGAGAFTNGARVRVAADAGSREDRRGAVFTRFMPQETARKAEDQLPALATLIPGFGCAGKEYPDVTTGGRHFTLFWRGLPWDHAPGALYLREAGGSVLFPDGTPYDPVIRREGIILARSAGLAGQIVAALA